MNHFDVKLLGLGRFVDTTRRQMRITQELLCAEVMCSKNTYLKV